MRPTAVGRRVRLALVGLAIAAVAATTLPAQQAAADHTPLPDTVTLVGSLQSELGCPGDWQPECDATHLQPVAGEPGVFRGTFTVPAGAFEYKAAINESFDENYGAGGAQGGANIPLTAPGGEVMFTYNHTTHVITDDTPRSLTAQQAAHWVTRDLIAWDLPDEREGFSYRLYWAAEGGLTNDDGTITGGSSFPLELVSSGLPASVRREFPHLASFEVLRVPASVRSRIQTILTGQIAVAAFDANGGLVSATGVQLPGVLDDVYSGAQSAALARPGVKAGRRWRYGPPPRRASRCCWTRPVPRRSGESRCGGTPTGCGAFGTRGLAQRPLPVRGHGLRAYHRNRRGESGDRPVLGRAHHQLSTLGAGQPRRSGAETGRLEPAHQAGAAQAGVLLDL